MKQVLWISRHEMTPLQFVDLERVMGGETRLILWKDTVNDVSVLRDALAGVDAAAAVLPPELLGKLLVLAEGKPVLRAVSERRPTGRTNVLEDGRREPEFAFVHRCWQQVIRVEFTVREL